MDWFHLGKIGISAGMCQYCKNKMIASLRLQASCRYIVRILIVNTEKKGKKHYLEWRTRLPITKHILVLFGSLREIQEVQEKFLFARRLQKAIRYRVVHHVMKRKHLLLHDQTVTERLLCNDSSSLQPLANNVPLDNTTYEDKWVVTFGDLKSKWHHGNFLNTRSSLSKRPSMTNTEVLLCRVWSCKLSYRIRGLFYLKKSAGKTKTVQSNFGTLLMIVLAVQWKRK